MADGSLPAQEERQKIEVTRDQAIKLRALAAACVDPMTGLPDETRWMVGVVGIVGQRLKPGKYEIVVKFRRPRMPDFYRPGPPIEGLPLRWQDDQTGDLKNAVMHYLAWGAGKRQDPPGDEAFEILREYVIYHIKAPCWRDVQAGQDPGMARDIERLIEKAEEILTLEDVAEHMNKCLELGLDPL